MVNSWRKCRKDIRWLVLWVTCISMGWKQCLRKMPRRCLLILSKSVRMINFWHKFLDKRIAISGRLKSPPFKHFSHRLWVWSFPWCNAHWTVPRIKTQPKTTCWIKFKGFSRQPSRIYCALMIVFWVPSMKHFSWSLERKCHSRKKEQKFVISIRKIRNCTWT